MEGIFKVVKSEVSFRKKFQNELQHQSRGDEVKKVEEGLLSTTLGFQDVQNAKWFHKFFFAYLCLEFDR